MDAVRALEADIARAQPDDLPDFLGELARLEGLVQLRLREHTPAPARRTAAPQMLTAAEVAERLTVSEKWVYANRKMLGGIKLYEGCVRFPENMVVMYLRRCS